MRYSVYIVSPPGYPHSQCFIEVAETLCSGLLELGYEARITTSVAPGTRHIVLGGNLMLHHLVRIPRDSIHYNLEQIENNENIRTEDYIQYLRNFSVWDYSSRNIEFMRTRGLEIQALLPVSYHRVLTRIDPAPQKDIDILFIGSLNERREIALREMQARGLRVVHLFNKYGAERDSYIARSKLLLNVHYYSAHILEQVRISYYLANSIPVLSESSSDAETDREWGKGVFFSPYDKLAESAVRICAHEDYRRQLGAAGFAFMSGKAIVPELAAALSRTPIEPL